MIALGLAHLTALDLPPVELVRRGEAAGFQAVGLRLHPATPGGVAYPLRDGTAAHAALRSALSASGVTVRDVEFIELVPDIEVAAFKPMFEAAAGLGATSVTVSGDDPEQGRLIASFATLCDLAADYGLRVDLEFMRWRVVGNLSQALAVVSGANRVNAAVLVDALHLIRSGSAPDDLARCPASRVRALQLCDAPLGPPPGQGGLPLIGMLGAVSPDVALSVEVPLPSLGVEERLAVVSKAARAVVAMARGG